MTWEFVTKFEKMPLLLYLLLYAASSLLLTAASANQNGYIVYCPCMGRFGNQAEQLLGSLLFAKSLNRTLVLPPFIHYDRNHNPIFINFQDVLQIEHITKYHQVVLLDEFILAEHVKVTWPPGKRQFFCHSPRLTVSGRSQSQCNALDGQPFKAFWQHYGVAEDLSLFYAPLTISHTVADDWIRKYPPDSYPVITLVGAPSPFPAPEPAINIAKHMKLSTKVRHAAETFLEKNNIKKNSYVSIHLRHGRDWQKACNILKQYNDYTQFFSSAQCTGYPSKLEARKQVINFETCLPLQSHIVNRVAEVIERHNSNLKNHETRISTLHIATDLRDDKFVAKVKAKMPEVRVFQLSDNYYDIDSSSNKEIVIDYLVDAYLMYDSRVFIGNCISSFSAFVARMRMFNKKSGETMYFGQDFSLANHSSFKDEL